MPAPDPMPCARVGHEDEVLLARPLQSVDELDGVLEVEYGVKTGRYDAERAMEAIVDRLAATS